MAARSKDSIARPCVPSGRKAGKMRVRASSQSCSGDSAIGAPGSGGGMWPLTGALASIGAR